MKLKILADTHIPFLKGVAEHLGEVEYLPGNLFTREAIMDKDALIVRTVTHFGEEILENTAVKLICSATIGYDHIDTQYCDNNNVAWRTAPGCNANSVEQYVTASLLWLANKYQFTLSEKTIGIVGVGNVGTKVEAACRKLGMRVLLNDPPRAENEGNVNGAFVDLDTIQQEADIITFHTPLIKSGRYATYHMADDSFLQGVTMKPFIINAARGAVTDNQALKRALKKGSISGVVMDCWEKEPDIDRELLAMADIATPHIAGYSADGKWTATKMSIENILNFFELDINPLFNEKPEPSQPVIDLRQIATDKQLAHAVWHSYDPVKETEKLKAEPEKFYWFRSNYPLRREYPAYRVMNANSTVYQVLQKLGFGS